MKNLKVSKKNLINTYYYNGFYEIEFFKNDRYILIKNINEKDHPNAHTNEWYFNNDEIIKEIIENANDEDIKITKIQY